MTENTIEQIIKDHFDQDSDKRLIIRGSHNKILGKDSLIYLCKLCFRYGKGDLDL
jgi:hypothetical protein